MAEHKTADTVTFGAGARQSCFCCMEILLSPGRGASSRCGQIREEVKDELMRRAVLRKFELHHGIRALLLSTGEEELVENALRTTWGCGRDGSGKNMLREILMEVRDEFGAKRHRLRAPQARRTD